MKPEAEKTPSGAPNAERDSRDQEDENGNMKFAYKPTTFMTNSPLIAAMLKRRYRKDHGHVRLLGGRVENAANYFAALCDAIVEGVEIFATYVTAEVIMRAMVKPSKASKGYT